MSGEHERDDETTRLHALIRWALANSDLPDELLEVNKEELDAVEPERLTRVREAILARNPGQLREHR